jgi:hypothetical protein
MPLSLLPCLAKSQTVGRQSANADLTRSITVASRRRRNRQESSVTGKGRTAWHGVALDTTATAGAPTTRCFYCRQTERFGDTSPTKHRRFQWNIEHVIDIYIQPRCQ